MSRTGIVIALTVVASCRPAPPSSAPPAPTTLASEPLVRTTVMIGESFRPASGDSAVRAFRPAVAPVDSGGECRLTRTSGNGATIVSANFPSFAAAHTRISLAFDSAGKLVRFSEMRGGARPRLLPGMTDAQRDSAMRAAEVSARSTSITFDYPMDQAVAANRGGGLPTQAVIGSVRAMENLAALGPPTTRLARARRLCSV